MNRCINFLSALLIACVAASCVDNKTITTAASCFVIEADESQQPSLTTYFERFAVAHDLSFAHASGQEDVFGYAYRNSESKVFVSLNLYMGERRASASLFTDRAGNCLICQAFDEFLRDEVGEDFKVVPCADVEGFDSPQLVGQ